MSAVINLRGVLLISARGGVGEPSGDEASETRRDETRRGKHGGHQRRASWRLTSAMLGRSPSGGWSAAAVHSGSLGSHDMDNSI